MYSFNKYAGQNIFCHLQSGKKLKSTFQATTQSVVKWSSLVDQFCQAKTSQSDRMFTFAKPVERFLSKGATFHCEYLLALNVIMRCLILSTASRI